MRQIEIFVAPFFVFVVIGDGVVRRRRPPASRREKRPCRDLPGCAAGRAPASDPRRRRTMTLVVTTKRVFMCTAGTFGLRRCAISEMPDAQNRGIIGGARNLRAEFGREFAMHGRAVHADLLEQPAAHHRHHAAAAGLAGVVGAVPGRAHEAARVARIERGRRVVFQFLEGRADVVAQRARTSSAPASCDPRSRTCPCGIA